jgi:AraC-like DNA-binding protein
MEKGRIVVIPAWLTFRGVVSDPFSHTWVSATTPTWSAGRCRETYKAILMIEKDDPFHAPVLHTMEQIRLGPSQAIAHTCHLVALVHMAVAKALETSDRPEPPVLPEMAPLLTYIDEHLDDDLRLSRLAGIEGCSEAHLSRLFSKKIGQSCSSYVRERRIAAAAVQLTQSQDSIDTIALAVGFADRYHFTRVFTAIMGQSPAAYRQQVLQSLSSGVEPERAGKS